MKKTTPTLRIAAAVAILGLLSAFSFPLVQEGYDYLGSSKYKEAQKNLLEGSLRSYLLNNPHVDWTMTTTTAEILGQLKEGVDLDFDGIKNTFLPEDVNLEQFEKMFRVVYKSPDSFKVVIR